MPSYDFWGTFTVAWSYDSAKEELTVNGTMNGKAMIGSPVVLTKQSNTGTFTGQNGNNSAEVDLTANFVQKVLRMDGSQTDPAKSHTHAGDF